VKSQSEEDKIKSIYTYVQKKYAWNGNRGFLAEKGVKALAKDKSGNVADINLMLVNLLIKAGVRAMPLVIKTRDEGLLQENYPSMSELNYVIAYVNHGDRVLMLDATSKYTSIGELPLRAVNLNGLVAFGKMAKILPIENPNTFTIRNVCSYKVNTQKSCLVGSGSSRKEGFAAAQYRMNQDYKDEEKVETDDLEDEEFGVENKINYTSIKGLEEVNEPIILEFEEEIYNEIIKVDDQIFIDALIDFGYDENPFVEEERTMPIFFGVMPNVSHVVTIALPEGYRVESVPEGDGLTLKDDRIMYKYHIEYDADNLKISFSFDVNEDVFEIVDYKELKNIYDSMVEKSKEKIVLTKI